MNPVIKQWLDQVSTTKNQDINEEYQYKNSIYWYGKAGEAIAAGEAVYEKVQPTGTSDGEVWSTDQATAATRQKCRGMSVVALASGEYGWFKRKGPREYKPDNTNFLDPVMLVDTVADGTAIMASATTDKKFESIGAADEEFKVGYSYSTDGTSYRLTIE